TSSQKTVVIGIDGLSLSLARSLSDKGIFKNISHLVNTPECIAITSELPDVSPVNWASFFTAKGPEEHGIYGFTTIDPCSYQLSLIDYTHVRSQAIWDKIAPKGKTSKIINLPCTYPAPAIRGMLISGFIAPDLENAVYPKAVLPMLKNMDYRLEADTIKGLTQPEVLLQDLKQTLSSRIRAFDLFWPDLAWDFFTIVFTELDRMSHFLQDAILDEKHHLHSLCMEVLKALDQAVGHVLMRYYELEEPKELLIVADHGFTTLECEVDINCLLRAEGLLSLIKSPENELDLTCIDISSRSFALDPGRIYIHTRKRFSRGNVSNIEYASLREKIRNTLLSLEHHGRKVMSAVYPGEEIYPSGKGMPPDLLCVPNKGFDLKAKFDRNRVFGHFGRTGTHSCDDVFFYHSCGNKPDRIRDILAAY
ncbi:MAG: alkaline phosphatase family protein, partial [Desulfonatronovibrio sp.]